ncbi:hypothetical protein chiPu_0010727 [Chiloscyllium punctatum]|uniref:Uncharacterized protein n=1 Tax=Chiloscyllium punctatum TaxID=137246 RepID=A0A401SPF9_CHIPU|nr:hypothetical protein [Chiloscyllium punctatum]
MVAQVLPNFIDLPPKRSFFEVVTLNRSYGAYSVTVPDQKKWSNLQKKATEELAALEKLKRRNIGHVSITPRAVGGKLTQEEVRRRQQQNFSKAEIIQAEISGQQSPKKET